MIGIQCSTLQHMDSYHIHMVDIYPGYLCRDNTLKHRQRSSISGILSCSRIYHRMLFLCMDSKLSRRIMPSDNLASPLRCRESVLSTWVATNHHATQHNSTNHGCGLGVATPLNQATYKFSERSTLQFGPGSEVGYTLYMWSKC